ncbi:MAG: host attachment protein [Gammaproteobacteria bacterium]|nr:host attachment protein [Gammaproteobacteria bacterium]
MSVRVVVTDRAQARIYAVPPAPGPLRLIEQLEDPQAHWHDRDFKSDRPGRVFDHAAGAGRRGAVAHHGTQGERSPSKHEAEAFAHRIAAALERSRTDFTRLVLVAEPGFLGQLRAVLPKALAATVVLEIQKDLVRLDERALGELLPAALYATSA